MCPETIENKKKEKGYAGVKSERARRGVNDAHNLTFFVAQSMRFPGRNHGTTMGAIATWAGTCRIRISSILGAN